MPRRALARLARLRAHPRAPLAVLAILVLLSTALRIFHLALPCSAPCRTSASHTLIFDEAYYVNAARVIDGRQPPPGATYHEAPLGRDPNAEHPQLGKLVMAGSISLLGDDPWGWRLGSVVFGALALVAMYGLVRAARGSPWLAAGATAVMAADNLALVHGRIGTLDIYVLALALLAGCLYLRGWPLAAGVAAGVAACMKLVGLEVLVVFVLLEALRVGWARGSPEGLGRTAARRGVALLVSAAAALATLCLGVWLMDVLVPAYDPGTHALYGGNPFTHISHMLSYAAKLKAVPHGTGISSRPWLWLFDQRPISYARVAVNSSAAGKVVASRAVFDARGEVNPFVIALALPALAAGLSAARRRRELPAAVGAAWCLGTFLAFAVQDLAFGRISYLYYVLLVLPGVYLLTARLFAPGRVPPAATVGWALALFLGLIELYPVRSLTGH